MGNVLFILVLNDRNRLWNTVLYYLNLKKNMYEDYIKIEWVIIIWMSLWHYSLIRSWRVRADSMAHNTLISLRFFLFQTPSLIFKSINIPQDKTKTLKSIKALIINRHRAREYRRLVGR